MSSITAFFCILKLRENSYIFIINSHRGMTSRGIISELYQFQLGVETPNLEIWGMISWGMIL